MPTTRFEYAILPNKAPDDQKEASLGRASEPRPQSLFRRYLISILLSIICVQGIGLVAMLAGRSCRTPQSRLYSPVQHLVDEELVVYDTSFEKDLSPFQIPSSPELDKKWDDLYNFGISRIPKHEAERLPNKTSPIPGDPGFYIAGLNVFHELHCLNMIRKALDPDYYPDSNMKTSEPSRKHISHCVDWLRNSIMCHSNTSVIVWQWNVHLNQSTSKARIPHSCKKFKPIQDWGKKNEILADYDHTIHLEDAPICCVRRAFSFSFLYSIHDAGAPLQRLFFRRIKCLNASGF